MAMTFDTEVARTYKYTANLDFDDLTVAALATLTPPISVFKTKSLVVQSSEYRLPCKLIFSGLSFRPLRISLESLVYAIQLLMALCSVHAYNKFLWVCN